MRPVRRRSAPERARDRASRPRPGQERVRRSTRPADWAPRTRSTRTRTSSGPAAPRRSRPATAQPGCRATGRSKPRSEPRSAASIAREMFVETYGREPVDARELSGHVARIVAQATTAVAGYDLSFSPVKSVSTLWAMAPREVGEVIEQAPPRRGRRHPHLDGEHAAYTRRGRNGVAQVDVKGLIAAAFTHRDSRAGDPDLHTHVAISNKVQDPDGSGWPSTGGRSTRTTSPPPSGTTPASRRCWSSDSASASPTVSPRPQREASARSVKSSESTATCRGMVQAPRPDRVRRAVLSADFQDRHGRPPTPKEAVELAQQANLETRQAKHEPRSLRRTASDVARRGDPVLGGEIGLRGYLRRALHASGCAASAAAPTAGGWTQPTTADARSSTRCSQQRAVWQENHVRAEAERRVRAAEHPPRRRRPRRRRRRRAGARARTCRCRWTPTSPPPAPTPRRAAPRATAARCTSSPAPGSTPRPPWSQAEQAIRGRRRATRRTHAQRHASRPGAARIDRQRCRTQPRPGAARAGAGHLRRPRPTRARPCRHRQDDRDAGAVSCMDQPPAAPSSGSPHPPPRRPCCARRSAPAPTRSPSCMPTSPTATRVADGDRIYLDVPFAERTR